MGWEEQNEEKNKICNNNKKIVRGSERKKGVKIQKIYPIMFPKFGFPAHIPMINPLFPGPNQLPMRAIQPGHPTL